METVCHGQGAILGITGGVPLLPHVRRLDLWQDAHSATKRCTLLAYLGSRNAYATCDNTYLPLGVLQVRMRVFLSAILLAAPRVHIASLALIPLILHDGSIRHLL